MPEAGPTCLLLGLLALYAWAAVRAFAVLPELLLLAAPLAGLVLLVGQRPGPAAAAPPVN